MLIDAIVKGDFQRAKRTCRMIVDKDKTQSNRDFCTAVKRILENSSIEFMELPGDVKDILYMEDTSLSFNEGRYFLSKREEEVLDEVCGMYEIGKKLTEMGIRYLNSLLLHGENGTGKTLFGKYIAYRLGLPFVYLNFSNTIESYLGETSKNIDKAFNFIENQKCVFMIDELDAVGLVRGEESISEMSRITIALMQALDRVKNDVVIVSATNRLDMIDKALLRRFTIRHEVKRFSEKELEGMVTKFLDDVGIRYDIENIRRYVENRPCQAEAINDVVRSIARSLRAGECFSLR